MPKSVKHSRWDDRLIEGFLRLLDHLQRKETTDEARKKFLGYYQLLDLFKVEDPAKGGKGQCPMCVIIHESLNHYFSTSLVEEINRAEYREPLQQSLGYCQRHSEYLRRFITEKRFRLGIAIVYEDVLSHIIEHFDLDSPVVATEQCPACSLENEIEDYATQLLTDYLHDDEFQKKFRNSGGVCLPHLRVIAEKTKNEEARKFLFEATAEHLSRTFQHLQELIRKNDYRFAGEKISKDEAASWQRAVHFFVGD